MRERVRVWRVPITLVVTMVVALTPSSGSVTAARLAPSPDGFTRWSAVPRLPAIGEYRYVLTARVRPLLVFWITRPDVGSGRIVCGQSAGGGRSYELLVGSDPEKAPMRLNRWGYVAESHEGGRSRVVGLMTETNEESVEAGKAALNGAPRGQHAFQAIRASVADGSASSQVIRVAFEQDFTLRDIEAVLGRLPENGEPTARLRVPDGTSQGFLEAVATLIRKDVAAAQTSRSGGPSRGQPFVYDRSLYDLTLVSSNLARSMHIGGTSFGDCLDASFEVRNRATGNRTPFSLAYPTTGRLSGIPVRIVYRPRWWFEAELTLADSQPAAALRPANPTK